MSEEYVLSYNGNEALSYTLHSGKIVLLPPQDLTLLCKTTEIRFLVLEELGEEVNDEDIGSDYGES